MRNMFMQSGVAAELGLELIALPARGLCVWLMVALLRARRTISPKPCEIDARSALEHLNALHSCFAENEAYRAALQKLTGATTEPWDAFSGGRAECGQAQDVCEAMAAHFEGHIPMLVLGRHADRNGFTVSCILVGDVHGPALLDGGAVVTYEGGPELSHVDVLVKRESE